MTAVLCTRCHTLLFPWHCLAQRPSPKSTHKVKAQVCCSILRFTIGSFGAALRFTSVSFLLHRATMAAPALPWARPEGCEQERREGGPEAEQQADLSLKAGDRIKVLWEIQSEDGESATKWWGATVQNDANAESSKATLRYDAHGEFEEEEAEVAFLSKDMLKDIGSETELYWGRESEIDGEEEDDDVAGEVDLRELCGQPGQPGSERDVAELEREALAQLQHLPMDHQVRVAEGFRSFVDHMSGHIKARAEASGAGTYVVTEADIHEFVGGFVKPK